jgi:DNA polymerase-3 subunit beta
LLESLNVVDGNKITFGFSGKLAPTVIKSTENDNYIHIIMPLKS